MALHRRRLLQSVAAASLGTFAGCATPVFSGNEEKQTTYTLNIDDIPVSPVEHALYEPSDGALFGDPARTALDDIIPEGRHTTYGYQPLSEDHYVERNGTYYQTKHIVTGQKRLQRTLVRGEPLPEDEKTPDDAIVVESLDKPTSRVVKILHSNAQTGSTADLLRDDAYVLRRPAEQESALAAGELDGRVVTMKKGGPWVYRIQTTQTELVETEHTIFAVEVATSREALREIVFNTRIDTELEPGELSEDEQEILEEAIGLPPYEETAPLSESYESLLNALKLAEVEQFDRKHLWYDGGYYRYSLNVSEN
ncbi:hypothetical protein ELS19_15900 [Halogeometricum borinquense]|uniref:Uncharacterized protein n=1 Tax=Halogeometricum borinquense TaxID=60847 RepID=A0A482TAP0_9EURY|nr:hypothetical protein [Halogeometricum borinquense]RYJ08073.1 hypothetical protein ELS19_15900 [Halogeometricum borinquense]